MKLDQFLRDFFRHIFYLFGYTIHRNRTVEGFHRDYLALEMLYCEKLNFHFRPKTNDEIIFKEVYLDNCYKLPTTLNGLTVLDLGAHIGSFSQLALRCGAQKLVAVEPDVENFKILKQNLANFSGTALYNNAIWKNEIDDLSICNSNALRPANIKTFQNNNLVSGLLCQKTRPITLEKIFREQQIEKIDFLKIDIEGAEVELFSTLPPSYFAKIYTIAGEWHGRETIRVLKQYLSPFYLLKFPEYDPNVGYFFAQKK